MAERCVEWLSAAADEPVPLVGPLVESGLPAGAILLFGMG
jgi:hypothetical protein